MILDLRKDSVLDSSVYESLKQISLDSANEFNSFIGAVSKTMSENLDWWVEIPASRHTLLSPLFYRFCLLHLIYELIQSGSKIEKVIVDSAALFRAVNEIKGKEGLNFEVSYSGGKLTGIFPNFIKSTIRSLWFCKQKLPLFWAAKKTSPISQNQQKNNLILIDLIVSPGFITKDRYYPGLWTKLNSEQKKRTFFVPTLLMMKEKEFEAAYHELRTSDKNFLIKEDYLTLSDLLYSQLHIFRIWFIKLPPQEVLGIDFSPLIREELLSGGGFNNAIEGLLNYRFAKRLKEKSFNLSLIIDWWEGQPLDKGWNLGFHTFFPKTPRKGYLGFTPRTMEIHLRPTESEVKYGAAPETISTIGEQFSKEMKSTNSPFKAETAPAFRFNHIWENRADQDQASGTFKILMALSIMVDESVNILEKVIESSLDFERDGIEFLIKPHPATTVDKLKSRFLGTWPHHFQVVEGPTPNYIRMSDLLITGMSSVGLEAVVLGTPVIVVETTRGLAYDPIPDSVPKELWRNCRSSEEISEAINIFRNHSPEEVRGHQELSSKIKKDYFEPVTKEGIYRFLELKD